MIIRSLTRRPNAIPSLLSSAQQVARPAPFAPIAPLARSIHNVPPLDNHHELQKNGIKGLFSPKAFDIAYTQYHQHIVDELNILTSGTSQENQDIKSLVIEYARDPQMAYNFNLASMAFNNHFFFSGINTNSGAGAIEEQRPSQDLEHLINENFTSVETCKDEMLSTAEAMFGPGFVWLVQMNDTGTGRLKILTTYLAGSPLSAAHYRRQEHDLSTHNADSYEALNAVGAFGKNAARAEKRPQKPLGGVDITPLLCVNTWQHAWLPDYGITGKPEYLEMWWKKIDWNKVLQYAYIPKGGSRRFKFDFTT